MWGSARHPTCPNLRRGEECPRRCCSTARGLNGHVLPVTCEHRPSYPPKLVCQSHDHDIAVRARKQILKPTAERSIFLGETRESRARPMDQQHPQVAVAALLMRRSLGFPPVVAWRGTNPNQAAMSRPQVNV
jgi:hypothetical protein